MKRLLNEKTDEIIDELIDEIIELYFDNYDLIETIKHIKEN